MISLNITPTHATLTATTANVIQGTAPWFAATSGENKLGFTLQGTYYSEGTGNIVTATVKEFDKDLTLNDFVVKALTASDFTASSDYADSDGDGAHPTAAFTVGTTTYEWRDSVGLIPLSDYGKSLNCGSGLSLPLTLKITLSNVQVHSEYGLPKDSTAIPLEKIYQITTTSGICYAKPNQMVVYPNLTWLGMDASGGGTIWNDTTNTTAHSLNGGGYSSDFVPNQGFKASASTKFFTTGFPKAKFQLVMTGLQTDWNYSVSATPNGSVTVDTAGNVTLNSKPTGTGYVTVTATLKTDSTVHHDYTFNPTTVWAEPKAGAGGYAWAQGQCGNESKILTRAELTNSPRNNNTKAPAGWSYVGNYYTRAIGGGVFGEWGYTNSSSYPCSQWVSGYYWTPDVHSTGSRQFVVYSYTGSVYYYSTSISRYVACRG